MANAQADLDAGNEARHTGDRLGFAHGVADGTTVDSASPAPGQPVVYDASSDELVLATATTDTIAGILFTYQVYGDSNNGPFVRGDRDATVAVRGSYVADLSAFSLAEDGSNEGTYLDDNGDIFIKNYIEGSLYEVVLR